MATKEELDTLIKAKGDEIRQLKADKAAKEVIMAQVTGLNVSLESIIIITPCPSRPFSVLWMPSPAPPHALSRALFTLLFARSFAPSIQSADPPVPAPFPPHPPPSSGAQSAIQASHRRGLRPPARARQEEEGSES
jgi:hypothetical protein